MTAKKPRPRPRSRLVFQRYQADGYVSAYVVYNTGVDQHIGAVVSDAENWWHAFRNGVEFGIRQRTRREAAEWLRGQRT